MTDSSSAPDLSVVPEPLAAPNPLGTGNIKLTLPTRRRKAPGPVDEGPDVAAVDPAGSAAVVDADALPGAGGTEQSADGDPVDDGDDGDDGDNDGSGSRGYGLDPHIVRVFGGLVAVVAVVAGWVWWFAQPTAAPKPVHTIAAPPAAGPAETTTVAPIAEDGPLQIVTSAVCPGQTDPKLAASTDKHSGWTCPTGGVPFGQKLTATLPQPSVITGIKFWPGAQFAGPDGRDQWFHYRLLQELQCVFNDRDLTAVTATPNAERHEYSMAVHVVASRVDCTVTASVSPPPQPATTPTSAPPGADPSSADSPPDLSSIFPATPTATPDGGNDPNGSSIAVTGFSLIGHAIK